AEIARQGALVAAAHRRADVAQVAVTVRGSARGAGGASGGSSGDDHWTPADAARDALRLLEVLAGAAILLLAGLIPALLLGALAPVDAVAITGDDMRRLLREHPDISMKLVVALGRRLRDANERLTRQSFQTVQSRVATVLSQLVARARNEDAAVAGDDAVLV